MPVNSMYETKEPLTEADLDALEKRLSIRLPRQYRRWLLRYNGGRPSPMACFEYKEEGGLYTDSCVAWFLAVYHGEYENFEATFRNLKLAQNRFPEELVPFARDPGGNFICIACSGPNEGKVYFWDHEEETDPPSYANCHLIADSFDEFIEGLHD